MIAEAPVSAKGSEARPNTGRTIYERDGVRAYARGASVHILLPHAKTEDEFSALYLAFQRIYTAGYSKVDWTVDVSAIPKIPLSLLSVLTSFRQELSEQGRRLHLTGVRPGAFPHLYVQGGLNTLQEMHAGGKR